VRIFLTIVLLLASAAVTAVSTAALPFYWDKSGEIEPLVWFTLALWILFALAYFALRKVPKRAAIVLVIAGSVAIGGAAMAGPPNTSTDSARYAWDGIVQNAGISPYEYVPADPELAHLRTDWLFPEPVTDGDAGDGTGEPDCVGDRIMTVEVLPGEDPATGPILCTTINRATVPTIYPPTSELFFAGVRALTGPDPQYMPMQVAGLLISLGVTGLLLRTLIATGRDPRWAALWGWSPLVATEGVTNSHIDILGAALLFGATVLVASGRRWGGSIALGAAIAVKLIPVIGAPALLGKQPWKIILGSIAAFLLLYVPYILASGVGVLGYLPGYLSEEGYESGSRFILLSPFFDGLVPVIIVAAVIAITAGLVWWKTDPANPWLGQLVMIGVVMLAVTPRYPWYALLLVPFVAMTGRWEWMAVPLALTERLLIPSADLARAFVWTTIAFIVAVTIRRMGPGGTRRILGAVPRTIGMYRNRKKAGSQLKTVTER